MPVDVGLAKLSNDLIAGGIVAYALGFLGFAIDAAYGNHAPGAAKPAPAEAAVARVPAMAGAASSASSAPTPTDVDAADAAARDLIGVTQDSFGQALEEYKARHAKPKAGRRRAKSA